MGLGHLTPVRVVGVAVERGLVVPSFLGLIGVRWGKTGQVWSLEASSALLLPGSVTFVSFSF